MDWLSLLLPFAYLTVLIGSLATFSSLYRRRQTAKAASLEPWFPPHLQRNVYLSLLELQSSPDTKVPDSILKAALFRRATEDIHRLISIRNSKPALSQLLQRGSVGDELWQRFLIAEKEMDEEVKDVVQEANALAPQQQWGQHIFQSANEAANREMLQRKLKVIEDNRAEEKERWEKRREMTREGLMKELESDTKGSGASSEAGKKQGSSDDDAVMVESGGPISPAGSTASGSGGGEGDGGKKKKKKGKR